VSYADVPDRVKQKPDNSSSVAETEEPPLLSLGFLAIFGPLWAKVTS